MKVFVTGSTGYIGGDALYALNEKYPDFEYSVLVRNEERGIPVKKAFPSVRLVYGNLDDSQIIEDESAKADIVLHTADASDHEGAAKAIAAGLARGHTSTHPGYWLHTGGTGILTYFDTAENRYGERSEKQFNDWDGVGELTSLPDEAFHRNVDKIVLEAAEQSDGRVKTALVCPPTIYGTGRGPGSKRSRQLYELAKMILKRQQTPIIGAGHARWNGIHVSDLSALFVLLAGAAASKDSSSDIWGPRGYYFVESCEFEWGALARFVARTAVDNGYLRETPKEVELSPDEAKEAAGYEAVSWGLNSRCKAERARRVLGWQPVGPTVEEEVPRVLNMEAESLGMGHRK